MAPPWQMWPPPEVKRRRRLPGGLTGNALVSGVVSAVVAGAISFGVAHQQSQDSARQAVAGQQASAAAQLEAAATTFYRDAQNLYVSRSSCDGKGAPTCMVTPPSLTTYFSDQAAFNADQLNVSDSKASALARQLSGYVQETLSSVGDPQKSSTFDNDMGNSYYELVTRCGQIIQSRDSSGG